MVFYEFLCLHGDRIRDQLNFKEITQIQSQLAKLDTVGNRDFYA